MPRQLSKILGLSFGHGDSSAALVVEGKLIAAAEEERFNRVKHYALFPTESVKYCLDAAGLRPSDIDVIAIARKPRNQFWRRVQLVGRYPEVLAWPFQKKVKSARTDFPAWLHEQGLEKAGLRFTEHHLAHMYSTRYLSSAEQMAFLSFDGLGDFVSAAAGRIGKHGRIEVFDRVTFPHSLGFFYTAMTQYLGFPYFGDEFKVMGLSSYGEPKYLPVMRRLVRERDPWGFTLNLEAFPILKNPGSFYVENGQPYVKSLFNAQFLTSLLGVGPRSKRQPLTHVHWDIAKSVQVRFEEVATHLLRYVETKASAKTIGLAGGCAHNSVWAGKIRSVTAFDEVVVAPASHDAGIAVGAAMALLEAPAAPDSQSHPALLGPSPARSFTATPEKLEEKYFKNEKSLIEFMAEELSQGKLIGLCRGRMEFGPRALGSRSILADPRSAEMRERLNARVKHREHFRPFAASVLEEQQHEWFVEPYYAPTMEAVFPVKESAKKKIPAVVHADGSCRIQSVRRSQQPFYWNLIDTFRKKTGVPMLINTSFNDSEPIVCTEDDAIRCFLNTELDYLVLEDRVLAKVSSAMAKTG